MEQFSWHWFRQSAMESVDQQLWNIFPGYDLRLKVYAVVTYHAKAVPCSWLLISTRLLQVTGEFFGEKGTSCSRKTPALLHISK